MLENISIKYKMMMYLVYFAIWEPIPCGSSWDSGLQVIKLNKKRVYAQMGICQSQSVTHLRQVRQV